MNNYQSKFTSPTLHLGFMAATLLAGTGVFGYGAVGPELPRDPHHGVEPKAYIKEATPSTYNRISGLLSEKIVSHQQGFEITLIDFFADLSKKQVNLPNEFSEILADNLWDLYSS